MTNDKQRKLWPIALALLALLVIIGAIVLHQNTRPSLDTSPIATPISPIVTITATSPPVATFTATPRPTPTPTSTPPPAATLVPAPTDTPAPTVTPVPPTATATATATAPTIGPVCQIQVNTIYYIQPGDSLWKIADCAYGDPFRWPDIYNVNSAWLTGPPGLIHVGNPLWIPE